MRAIILMLLTGCSSAPIIYSYPSGLRIIRADQYVMAQACAEKEGHWDNGRLRRKGEAGIGCYRRDIDTIYVEDSCAGAKAIVHELAHREGVKDPDSAGFSWRSK